MPPVFNILLNSFKASRGLVICSKTSIHIIASKEKELLDAYKLGYLRHERNLKLTETDWVITMHKELGTNIPASWKTYRQELRDITKTYNSIDDDGFKWPSAPSE